MTLLRVGHRILNLDNVTSVNLAYPAGPTETCVRVFFVGGTNAELSWTDFKGQEADDIRRYFGEFTRDITRPGVPDITRVENRKP
jgi:hypothetical protein